MTSKAINRTVVNRLDHMMQQRLQDDIHVVITKYGEHHVLNHTTDEPVLMDLPDRDLADWICDGINLSDGARRKNVVYQVKNIWHGNRAAIHKASDQVHRYHSMINSQQCDEVIYTKLADAEHRLESAMNKMSRRLQTLFMVNRKRSSF